ncbi:MAG TPA: diaminopimelate decarboxylase [Gemmatimonadales bacterium]
MGESVLTASPLSRAGAEGEALACEGVSLTRLAEAVGTPAFVYSAGALRQRYADLSGALAGVRHRVHYSVKANGNLALLKLLRQMGAGVDIVSAGELHRALLAGFVGRDIVFSGVGKTEEEIELAIRAEVLFFNVESEGELELIARVAGRLGRVAPVALRVNPEVDVETPHEYTRTGGRGHKFGIPYDEVYDLARRAMRMPEVSLVGLDMHIGSHLTSLAPFRHGVRRLMELLGRVRAAGADQLRWLDLGGGMGVRYAPGDPELDLEAFGALVRAAGAESGLDIVLEPGRFLVANAGILLTRVLYRKRSGGTNFVITDAGMTELIRPSHYQAYHGVEPVAPRAGGELVDVVGPICESGDFLAHGRDIGDVQPGDLVVVHSAGAYGYVMASNYNARRRPAEVLVDGDRFAVVTRRETFEDLTRLETVEPEWES